MFNVAEQSKENNSLANALYDVGHAYARKRWSGYNEEQQQDIVQQSQISFWGNAKCIAITDLKVATKLFCCIVERKFVDYHRKKHNGESVGNTLDVADLIDQRSTRKNLPETNYVNFKTMLEKVLSAEQYQIALLKAKGLSDEEIAQRLRIESKDVRRLRSSSEKIVSSILEQDGPG